jgi:hypothetical protein
MYILYTRARINTSRKGSDILQENQSVYFVDLGVFAIEAKKGKLCLSNTMALDLAIIEVHY